MAFADVGAYELESLDSESQEHTRSRFSAQVEDLYWSASYWKQPYYRADYDYEDYAPAYCVGYSGCAQYGGRFEEAEKSLCANFIRIKGDSRLTWEEAIEPIRAAWERIECGAALKSHASTAVEREEREERDEREACLA